MKLRETTFRATYDTNFDDDVVNDFYIPALSNSKEYKRMSGFFSSSSLAVSAEGIENFIRNSGTMKLLTSPFLDSKDVEMLSKIEDDLTLKEFISDKMNQTLDSDKIREDHVEALGWMLANKKLEIRVVLVKNERGNYLTSDEVDSSGMFHNKVGILSDGENTLAFSGSINETYSGWKRNIENFHVFCDWKGESEHIMPLCSRFDKYWEVGSTGRSQTIELPTAVKNNLMKSVPLDRFDLNLFKKSKNKQMALRNYQTEAIDSWFNNNCQGIFNMATGTGKTITAIYAIKRFLADEEKTAIVIAVPFQHLIGHPWAKTIENEITTEKLEPNIILAYGDSKKWIKDAKECVENINFDVINNIFFVTTYDTLSSQKFIDVIKDIKCRKLLVADEVHNSGAETYRLGLLEEYKYRLGLSATPSRHYDEDGTDAILSYFKKEVFFFSLERAIKDINPDTGASFLTPYYYEPIFVSLTEEEVSQYREISAKIAKFANSEKLEPPMIKARDRLLNERSRVLKNAVRKIDVLKETISILKSEGKMDHCLIYCSDGKDSETEERTITKVIKILNNEDISNRRFTSGEKSTERAEILEKFGSGEIETLVAIKCLDEGVDVPATKNAIIMASTGNPREYVQRRGRVLRRFKDKEYATIFDFIVVPNDPPIDPNIEGSILKSEYKRFKEFSFSSINRSENESIIGNKIKSYPNWES